MALRFWRCRRRSTRSSPRSSRMRGPLTGYPSRRNWSWPAGKIPLRRSRAHLFTRARSIEVPQKLLPRCRAPSPPRPGCMRVDACLRLGAAHLTGEAGGVSGEAKGSCHSAGRDQGGHRHCYQAREGIRRRPDGPLKCTVTDMPSPVVFESAHTSKHLNLVECSKRRFTSACCATLSLSRALLLSTQRASESNGRCDH